MTKAKQRPTIPVLENPTNTVRVSQQDELDVWVTGEGSPVVLSHGANWPDLLVPLRDELVERGYQAIYYHRRGYSGRPSTPFDYSANAVDIVKILDALGIEKAHVIGHSYATDLVLDLGAEFPERVRSVVAMEGLAGAPEEVLQAAYARGPELVARYQGGDGNGAVTDLLAGLGIVADDLVEQLTAEGVANFFEVDVPTGATLQVDLAKLGQNGSSVAAMLSSEAGPLFVEASAGITAAAPQTRQIVMPDSDHMFPIRKPAETAAVLDEWFRSLDA
ncbi:MAG: alpha/beta fold hydrolase [Nitriliruptorales bacterium]|nr:alpha/beta fold hydrolase [Nitriliruptorales bacterium]